MEGKIGQTLQGCNHKTHERIKLTGDDDMMLKLYRLREGETKTKDTNARKTDGATNGVRRRRRVSCDV